MVRFGPFAVDTRTWTLSRDGASVDLSPRLVQILAYLVERDGEIVTRDDLLDRFWPDLHITENTLTRALADIRKALDDDAHQPRVIQTIARRGYRFVGQAHPTPAIDDALRQWVEGRLALETLDPARLSRAREAMQAAAAAMPGYAPARAGIANACVVGFEATRIHNVPDMSALRDAVAAARDAARLDASLGEAWAVLGHALGLAGETDEAQAALRRATALEPDNWRHQLRLALVSWGEARLRAANRALALQPSCAAAHLLSAMVFVARGAWGPAEAAAAAGAGVQDAQVEGGVLPAAGLHWIAALACAGRGDGEAARQALLDEYERPRPGVYGREFRWLAAAALGFLELHAGALTAARAAFDHAETVNPGAARHSLGRHLAGVIGAGDVERALAELETGGKRSEAVLVRAAWLGWQGEEAAAIGALEELLTGAAPGPLGWSLAGDPMFLPLQRRPAIRPLLTMVATRAG